MKQLVILGAGTAGTMMANKLVRALPADQWRVTVVDRDDRHLYQPGLLFVPFGASQPGEIQRSRRTLFDSGVHVYTSEIDRIDPDGKRVHFTDGESLAYDVLIIATGTRVAPEATDGLTGEGWRDSAFDFYTLEGATALAEKLDGWKGGRLVLNVADMPIKCPVAPLGFLFLAEAFLTERGLRDRVEIVYATPLDGAFTKPVASRAFGTMLADRGIAVETEFVVEAVDGQRRQLTSYDGRALDYDLLVTVPLHFGAEAITTSQMGDESGFVPTDKHTLQAKNHRDVFVLGDATDLPASKAGSVAHFQAEVLHENILRHIAGKEPIGAFDGHANCFIESGYGKAILIDFNYDTEPLPGRFPLPGIGPFTLLEESHVNHWGKLGFRWMYWNLLVRGKELPIDHRMLMAGKWSGA